jgi:hypothetical protein
MDLHVIIDNSKSMRQAFNEAASKFEVAGLIARRLVENPTAGTGEIQLSYFSDMLEPLVKSEDPAVVLETLEDSIGRPLRGATKLWDCLREAVEGADSRTRKHIICVTDGEDGGSHETREGLFERVQGLPGVAVTVVDLSKEMRGESSGRFRVVTGDSIREIGDNVERRFPKAEAVVPAVSLPAPGISAAVIPLVDCTEEEQHLVLQEIREAIPGIEKRTGLRYYPAPTFIVDEEVLKEAGIVPPPVFAPNGGLAADIFELLKFLEAMCLTYHTGSFNVKLNCRQSHYADFLRYDAPTCKHVFFCAEGLCNNLFIASENLGSVLRGLDKMREFFIPGYSKSKRISRICRDNFNFIEEALAAIAKKHPAQIVLNDTYFRDTRRDSPRGREPAKLEVWRKHLKGKELTELLHCADQNGIWKKDLESILTAFRITVDLLFRLFAATGYLEDELSPLIGPFRTFGFYLPPGVEGCARFQQLLTVRGFSRLFKSVGRVALCLSVLRKRVEECASRPSAPPIEELLRDVLLETIVHEHSHAAFQEGLNGEGKPAGATLGTDKDGAAVNEALAEWSAFDHFRGHPFMADLIRDHAESGKWPRWPYAGAARIEEGDGVGAFRFVFLLRSLTAGKAVRPGKWGGVRNELRGTLQGMQGEAGEEV